MVPLSSFIFANSFPQITSFLILHILNFITPLTPSKHNHSSSTSLSAPQAPRKVDITAPGLRRVFTALVDAEGLAVSNDVDSDVEIIDGNRTVDVDLFVKVSPPIYVRLVLPTSMLHHSLHPSSKSASRSLSAFFSRSTASLKSPLSPSSSSSGVPTSGESTSDFIDQFMSSWTLLVGDPILSKWIVMMLALSVALNGYLLKGIAAGLVGGNAPGGNVWGPLFGPGKGEVRFAEEESEEEEEEVKPKLTVKVTRPTSNGNAVPAISEKVAPPSTATPSSTTNGYANGHINVNGDAPNGAQPKKAPDSPTALAARQAKATFTLEDVDRRLVAAVGAAGPSTSSTTFAVQDAASTVPTDSSARSLAECLDIFENGPRPLAESLALLNDEEVVMLVQNGKIAAYALEKVFGGTIPGEGQVEKLERAVRVRRMLICEYYLFQL